MVDYVKGQTVTVSRPVTVNPTVDSQGAISLNRHTSGTVTSVTKNKVRVRIAGQHDVTATNPWTNRTRQYGLTDPVVSIPRTDLDAPNGETYAAPVKPKVRPIGEKPEGDHLDVDDPRIQWIFEDAARVAKNAGHCWDYDNLCDRIGIPGRERDITVNLKVKGIDVRTTVKARSSAEAERKVREALSV